MANPQLMNLVVTVDSAQANRAITSLSRSLSGAAKVGVQDLTGWQRSGLILGDVFHNLGIRGSAAFGLVGRSMLAMGAGALGVSASIAGLMTLLKGASEHSRDLQASIAETHLDQRHVDRWIQLGNASGLSSEQTVGGLSKISELINNIQQHTEVADEKMREMFAHSGGAEIWNKIQAAAADPNRMRGVERITAIIGDLQRKNPEAAKVLNQSITAITGFNRLAGDAPRLDKLLPSLIDLDPKRMKEYADSIQVVEGRFTNLKNMLLNEAEPVFKEWNNDLSDFLGLVEKPIGDSLKVFFDTLLGISRRTKEEFEALKPYLVDYFEKIGAGFKEIDAFLNKIGMGPPKKLAEPGTPEREKQDREAEKAEGLAGAGEIHRALVRKGVIAPAEGEHVIPDPHAQVAPESEEMKGKAPYERFFDYYRRNLEAERAEQDRLDKGPHDRFFDSYWRKPVEREHSEDPSVVTPPRDDKQQPPTHWWDFMFGAKPAAPSSPSITGDPAAPPAPSSIPGDETVPPGFLFSPNAPELPAIPPAVQPIIIPPDIQSKVSPPVEDQRYVNLPESGNIEDRRGQPYHPRAPLSPEQQVAARTKYLMSGDDEAAARHTREASGQSQVLDKLSEGLDNLAQPHDEGAAEWLRSNMRSEAPVSEIHNSTTNFFGDQDEPAPRARLDSALGQQSGMQKVEGSATLDINVKAPRSTEIRPNADGMFKEITLNRSSQMEMASDG